MIARPGGGGTLEQLEHGAIGTRLGEGLAEGGPLGEAAMARTLGAIETFAARVRVHGAQPFAIATSAMRRASNAAEFSERVRALVGAGVRVLDGGEEGACSFRGATASAPRDGRRRAVLDVGGGSTECAAGRDGVLDRARSVEIGSVRLTERFPDLAGNAPGERARAAAAAARRTAAQMLAWLGDYRPVDEVRCVAGTPLTVGAIAFDSHVDRVSGRELSRAALDGVIADLLERDLASRKAVPGMLAQRADVLPAGGIIVSEALRLLGRDSAVLEADDLLSGFLLGVKNE